jgi:hypothetical protein
VRLWVNGKQLINQWQDQGLKEYSGQVELLAGVKYSIKLEFFQSSGDGDIKLMWSSPSTDKTIISSDYLYPVENPEVSSGFTGQYYNKIDLNTSNLGLTRTDPVIDFMWFDDDAPATGIDENYFSIRWTGEFIASFDGTYTFYVQGADDGVRLWVNNELIIDKWDDTLPKDYSGTIDLVAGEKYSIKLEYFDYYGWASARLSWKKPSGYKGLVPPL